jgi:poly(A) polymerase
VRFAAKLSKKGFTLDPKTAKPLVECAQLLQEVPQSRMFDEMLKLLQTGHSLASIEQLRLLGLAKGIYPLLDVVVDRADLPFVQAALMDTDRRVAEGKSVAPSFLLACVLWQDVKAGWDKRMLKGEHPHPALQDAIDDVFNHRIGDVSGRGKLAADMREIWVMQPRFEKRTGSTPFGMIAQARFRAGFDFLRLRADVGEVDEALANWWQEFQQADEARREDLIAQVRDEQRAKPKAGAPKPKRAPRKPAATEAQEGSSLDQVAQQAMDSDSEAHADAPAKKRRRRRRKPGSGDAGGAAAGGGGADAAAHGD